MTLAKDSCGEFFGCLPNTHERVSEIPVIAIDNSTGAHAGTLYAAFYTLLNTYMEQEVAHSTGRGASSSKPVRVTPTTDKHDQFFNWIHVSSKGVVGIAWLDRRNDPANISYQAYASFSTNGGVSFQANKNLASVSSNPLDDGFGGYFMGDYTGNAWYGTKLYVASCDTRNGGFLSGRAVWVLQRALTARLSSAEPNWSHSTCRLLSLPVSPQPC